MSDSNFISANTSVIANIDPRLRKSIQSTYCLQVATHALKRIVLISVPRFPLLATPDVVNGLLYVVSVTEIS